MLTVAAAFEKFRSRLEITATEESIASRTQQRIRQELDGPLDVDDDFLTGAYRRDTKTKPLRDVDIMVVLTDTSYLNRHPHSVLEAVRAVLVPTYGDDRVCCDRRAVRVDSTATVNPDGDDVLSFDVVPGFADDGHYLIPDDVLGEWVRTNPKVHAEKATAANKRFSGQWKPLVKMIKKWNNTAGSPVQPSFLIEVMALTLITGEWSGSYPYEARQFFATAADRLDDGWPDPAGVGPNVSDVLDADPMKMALAREYLVAAEKACTEAMRLDHGGRAGEALAVWQQMFGPLFAKS